MKITVEGIPRPEKGAANGVCPLDGTGKVDTSFLPASVTGAMEYKGPWDASGGTYPTPAGLELGWYYKISVKGTLGIGVAEVGDQLVCEDPVAPTWSLYQGNLTTGDLAGEVQANGANLTALQVMETDATKKLISAAKGTAYNKNFGAATGNVPQIAAAGLGNSQTAETDGTGKLITAGKGTAYNKSFGDSPGRVPNIGVAFAASRIVETNATKLLITAVKQAAYNKAFGAGAGTVCQGNDARLPSAGEKAALPGTNGVPSAANKYVTDSDPRLVAPTTIIQGSEEAEDTTTNNAFTQSYRFSPTLEIAKYMVQVSCEITADIKDKPVEAQVQIDDTTTILTDEHVCTQSGNEWDVCSAVYFYNCPSAAAHNFDFDFRMVSDQTAKIRRKRIILTKVVE